VGACNVNINYNMKALRSKKHCGDTVAHESAHASPRVIVGEVEKKYIYPQKEKNGQRYYLQKSNDY
jgi:hypothetical protein